MNIFFYFKLNEGNLYFKIKKKLKKGKRKEKKNNYF